MNINCRKTDSEQTLRKRGTVERKQNKNDLMKGFGKIRGKKEIELS